jgi:hypothetical protein
VRLRAIFFLCISFCGTSVASEFGPVSAPSASTEAKPKKVEAPVEGDQVSVTPALVAPSSFVSGQANQKKRQAEPSPRECEARALRGCPFTKFMDRMEGFARLAFVSGGLEAPVILVTSLEDSGPGSLREALAKPSPKWIRFERGGDIFLKSPLEVSSNTTLEAQAARINLLNHGLVLRDARNVVLENLRILPDGTTNEHAHTSGIELSGAEGVWIDHCEISGFSRPLLSLSGSTSITVSASQLQTAHAPGLVVSESNGVTHLTLHHNFVTSAGPDTFARLPNTKVHIYNNVFNAEGGVLDLSVERTKISQQQNSQLVSEAVRKFDPKNFYTYTLTGNSPEAFNKTLKNSGTQ